MPLKGLRPNRSDRDLKRHSTLDPAGLFKRNGKDTRLNKSTEHLAVDRAAASVDGARPASSDVTRPSWSASNDDPPPSPPVHLFRVQTQTLGGNERVHFNSLGLAISQVHALQRMVSLETEQISPPRVFEVARSTLV